MQQECTLQTLKLVYANYANLTKQTRHYIIIMPMMIAFLPKMLQEAVHMQRLWKIDNWGGGGAHIHIFVFTDCKNNRFQKKLMMHNTNI